MQAQVFWVDDRATPVIKCPYCDQLHRVGFVYDTAICPVTSEWFVPVPRSRYIRSEVRERLLAVDGCFCIECLSTDRLEVDHIFPYSLGGPSELWNLQVLCGPCNRRKGADILRYRRKGWLSCIQCSEPLWLGDDPRRQVCADCSHDEFKRERRELVAA